MEGLPSSHAAFSCLKRLFLSRFIIVRKSSTMMIFSNIYRTSFCPQLSAFFEGSLRFLQIVTFVPSLGFFV
jgi:hypothetical protein